MNVIRVIEVPMRPMLRLFRAELGRPVQEPTKVSVLT